MHILMGITILELEIINEIDSLFHINSILKKGMTTECLEENLKSN